MYKFVEHTADIMYEVKARSLKQLFSDAAKALFVTMADVKTVKQKTKKRINIENNNIDILLYEFLNEIVYLKDKDYMVFSKINISLVEKDGYKLKAGVYGEKINPKKQKLGVDVKAVTMHLLRIQKKKGQWVTNVVLDI